MISAAVVPVYADLNLTDGQTYSLGPLVNSGNINIDNATTLMVTGDVSNSGSFTTAGGGGNQVTVSGAFNNSGALNVNSVGDVFNVRALSNSNLITLSYGTTLNITGGGSGVTDISGGARILKNGGSFNVINNGVATSALANLASIEGMLSLADGQNYSFGSITDSGNLGLNNGTTVTVAGNMIVSGAVSTLGSGNSTINVTGTLSTTSGGQLSLGSAGDVANIGALSNLGLVSLSYGTTLNITGGGLGVTDIPASARILKSGGSFNVINNGTSTSALAKLSSVEGMLRLSDGQSYTTGSINNSGSVGVYNGTTLTVAGNLTNSDVVTTSGGNNTLNITGTLSTTSGGSFSLGSAGDVANIGAINNSGLISLSYGTTLNITGGGAGVTDIPGKALILKNGGSFNVINNGVATSALANLATIEGTLSLTDGQNYSFGSLAISASGSVLASNGTTMSIAGDISNASSFQTSSSGTSGNTTVNVSGTFTNVAESYPNASSLNLQGQGDVVNVGALNNLGTVNIASGTTLNITGGGPGVTGIAAGATFTKSGGSFNVINSGVATSALANLSTIAGTLSLLDGQSYSFGPLTVSTTGALNAQDGTTISIAGDVNNASTITIGDSGINANNTMNVSGTFTNLAESYPNASALHLQGQGNVVNVGALKNQGNISIGNGTTLNITGGGPGVTGIAAGATFTKSGGSFNVINSGVATSALANLSTIAGTLSLLDGQSYSFGPLTVSTTGALNAQDGTTISIAGDVNNASTITIGDSGINANNTMNVSGTFTNLAESYPNASALHLQGQGNVVNVGALKNQGNISIGNGATLNITGGGPGVTAIAAGATFIKSGGSFNVINNGVATSALANLSSIAGTLSLFDGQSYGFGPLTVSNTGALNAQDGTTISIAGDVSNAGSMVTGYSGINGNNTINVSGVLTNQFDGLLTSSILSLQGQGDVVSVGELINFGLVSIYSGATLRAGIVMNYGTITGLINFTGNLNNGGTLTLAGNQNAPSGTTFNNTGGTATFVGDTAPAGGTLLLNLTGGTVKFTSDQHLLGLSIGQGSQLQVTATTGQRSILYTPSIAVAGTLDLTDNNMIVQAGGAGGLSTVTGLVRQGYNNGTWTGTGMTSSTAASNSAHLTAIGVILNTADGTHPLYGNSAPLGLFDGANPGPADVLVKYTYYGDTDLKGYVDGSDYSRIDNAYLANQTNSAQYTGWFNGDFNYDGIINGSDYTLIDNAFNSQGASLAGLIAFPSASATDQVAGTGATSAVPEPTSLGLLALTPLGLIGRRRHN